MSQWLYRLPKKEQGSSLEEMAGIDEGPLYQGIKGIIKKEAKFGKWFGVLYTLSGLVVLFLFPEDLFNTIYAVLIILMGLVDLVGTTVLSHVKYTRALILTDGGRL